MKRAATNRRDEEPESDEPNRHHRPPPDPVREAFKPVLSWYNGGGEIEEPSLAKMVASAVADLQHDRCLSLGAIALLERVQAACHQEPSSSALWENLEHDIHAFLEGD